MLDKCTALKINAISSEDLALKINPKDKKQKELKKWAQQFRFLFISDTLLKNLPKLGGPMFNRLGRFPTPININDDIPAKIEATLATIKFQLKKVVCLGVAIGHDGMDNESIRQNLNMSINFLVSLLKKGWNNVKSIYIRTTMGKPVRLF